MRQIAAGDTPDEGLLIEQGRLQASLEPSRIPDLILVMDSPLTARVQRGDVRVRQLQLLPQFLLVQSEVPTSAWSTPLA